MEKVPNTTPEDKEYQKEREAAVLIIGEMRQQAAIMGANNFEIPAFDNLLVALNERQITPREAIAEARKILESKSDYH